MISCVVIDVALLLFTFEDPRRRLLLELLDRLFMCISCCGVVDDVGGFWPDDVLWFCRVAELYGGGAGVAAGFAVLGGGNGGSDVFDDVLRYGLPYTALYRGSMFRPLWSNCWLPKEGETGKEKGEKN